MRMIHGLSLGFQLAVLLAIVPFISASPWSSSDDQPTIVQNVGAWYYFACFSDSPHKRTLSMQVSVEGGQDNNSVVGCTEACKLAGYGIAGVEAGRDCYCDGGIENGGKTISPEHCRMSACSGNSSEACGGPNSLLTYYTD